MWLYGFVGCGKSAIAQTIAERVAKRGRLGGSFFFFRASGDRGRIWKLPATLAYQISLAIPSTAPLIRKAVEEEPGLLMPDAVSLHERMRRLVYAPIEAAVSMTSILLKGPYLIILDGLDECEDRDQVEQLVVGLLAFLQSAPSTFPLRFLITSRVEEHIRQHLQTDAVALINLADHAADADIEYFLRMLFTEEARRNRTIQSYGSCWP